MIVLEIILTVIHLATSLISGMIAGLWVWDILLGSDFGRQVSNLVCETGISYVERLKLRCEGFVLRFKIFVARRKNSNLRRKLRNLELVYALRSTVSPFQRGYNYESNDGKHTDTELPIEKFDKAHPDISTLTALEIKALREVGK